MEGPGQRGVHVVIPLVCRNFYARHSSIQASGDPAAWKYTTYFATLTSVYKHAGELLIKTSLCCCLVSDQEDLDSRNLSTTYRVVRLALL
jgi:hypothetical protein